MPADEPTRFYAHSFGDEQTPSEHWQPLADHLRNVAALARQFAQAARPGDTAFHKAAEWAGLLHDLGKYRKEFQDYLVHQRKSKETQHAAYGAAAAAQRAKSIGLTLAIAGHHSGLHDLAGLQNFLAESHAMDRFEGLLPTALQEVGRADLDAQADNRDPLRRDVDTRMLFSTLVDADRLDTAAHEHGALPAPPELTSELCAQLLRRVETYVGELQARAPDTPLSKTRADIFARALATASQRPGFFTMTVPTGGGKTLASLAFSLRHAYTRGLRRIIFVIPYLSIIEQNASEYREVLGGDFIVEHHSGVAAPEDEDEFERARRSPLVLATENWDSPIIVTTSVQFLESLFGRSPSVCRRLHNIARSIVVFDEVQTLPGHLLNPTMSVLREFVRSFGTSFVFCSATQPGFRQNRGLTEGLADADVIEIAPEPARTFARLRRVRYQWLNDGQPVTCDQLSEMIGDRPQVLVVVNTRKAALDLWEVLRNKWSDDPSNVFHLSSAMCAEHRLATLGKRRDPAPGTIHHRLQHGQRCRLVATQVVEAGVDIDFPVVYRALGPLDGIIQAAGRCNREGRLESLGDVFVFQPADAGLPPGAYTTATGVSATLLAQVDWSRVGDDPNLYARYFENLYGQLLPTDLATRGQDSIQKMRTELRFRTIAEKVNVIEKGTTSVVVPFGQAVDIVDEMRRRAVLTRWDLRRLQRLLVNVRGTPADACSSDFRKLMRLGALEPIVPDGDLCIVTGARYHPHLGLLTGQQPAEDFIV